MGGRAPGAPPLDPPMITDPTFIVALNVGSYTLGFTKPLSVMLQATSADIIKAYNNINLVQTQLQVLRKDCDQVFDESIWKNATHMATIAETELIAPRICQRMTKEATYLLEVQRITSKLQSSSLQLIIYFQSWNSDSHRYKFMQHVGCT